MYLVQCGINVVVRFVESEKPVNIHGSDEVLRQSVNLPHFLMQGEVPGSRFMVGFQIPPSMSGIRLRSQARHFFGAACSFANKRKTVRKTRLTKVLRISEKQRYKL